MHPLRVHSQRMLTKTPPPTEEKTRHITSKRTRRQAGQSLAAKAVGLK